MLTIDTDSPIPLIDQLVRGLRRAIARGEVLPGDELPSVRQLAGDLGVNLNTVARAYRALEERGLVRSARGRGTRVVADREATPEGPGEVRARLLAGIRDLLADAKLAGMDRAELLREVESESERTWRTEGVTP